MPVPDFDTAAITADLDLVDQATEAFLAEVGGLDERSVHEPSLLPGWTRGHVITHLARNADGMARLARWARTGVEEPMYGDRHPRNRDIEEGAARRLEEQQADVRDASRRLAAAFADLSGPAWSVPVRTATREVLASDLPWLRTRELWLHAIDLGRGAAYRDLPPRVASRLLHEVARDLAGRPGMPALSVTAGDAVVDIPGAGAPVQVKGTPGAIACWLSGRPGPVTRPDGAPLPPLPPWL